MAPSERRFGNDDDVARPHWYVPFDAASIHEIVEAHPRLLATTVHRSDQTGTIPSRKLRQTADLDHDIEQRHALAVRHCAGPRCLTQHPNLVAERANEGLNDDIDLRRTDEL